MTLGTKIRTARELADVRAVELARAVGVTPNTIYRWERDEVEPSVSTLEAVAQALGGDLLLEFACSAQHLEHNPPDEDGD